MFSQDEITETMNRLARVQVYGSAALAWAQELDPNYVRQISDQDIANIVAGVLTPPSNAGDHVFPDGHLYPS